MTTLSWPKYKPWFTVILANGASCFTVRVEATSQYTAIDAARRHLQLTNKVPDHELDALDTYGVFLGIQENLVQSDGPPD
jgi:hypothetical protein